MAVVLSQYDHAVVLHVISYRSMKHSPAECINHISKNQLIEISKHLEEWEPECERFSI